MSNRVKVKVTTCSLYMAKLGTKWFQENLPQPGWLTYWLTNWPTRVKHQQLISLKFCLLCRLKLRTERNLSTLQC